MKLRMERNTFTVEIEHNSEMGIFEVDPMTPEESSAALKKYTPPKRWVGTKMVEPETDWLAIRIHKVIKTIKTWNVTDEKDKAVECNDANKKTAYLLNPELINKVLAEADALGMGIEQQEMDELKNLLAG